MTAREFFDDLGRVLRRDTPAFGGPARKEPTPEPKCTAVDGPVCGEPALSIPCGLPAVATATMGDVSGHVCVTHAGQARRDGWTVVDLYPGKQGGTR